MELVDDHRAYSSGTVDKDIREFFRAERKRLRLNQEDVAVAGGVKQSTISKIERDAPYQPGLEIFIRAVRGLGMTPSQFFAKFEARAQQQHAAAAKPVQNSTDRQLPDSVTSPASQPHGDPALSSPSAKDDDIRAFFRVMQHALGGSIIAAIEDAQTRKGSARARRRKTRHDKGA